VSISGPTLLPTGVNGTYTASYLPVSTTLPITFTWDTGLITKSCAFGDKACDFSLAEIASTVGPTATFSWTMPGVYTISVTGTNRCGQASGAFTVTVCDPVGILSVTTAISGCLVDFGAALTGTAPFAYDWDFGPFGGSSAPTPTVDFLSDGTYPYTLTAHNCSGAYSNTYASEVTVACITCTPVTNTQFTWAPLIPTVSQTVTFTASASGTAPITYTWMLEPGTWKTGPVVTHSYGASGTYTVILTATNCVTAAETVVHTITVLPEPPEYRIYLALVLRNW
jgi:PKD repeat protein